MSYKIEVFRKADTLTPARFWDYGLSTEPIFVERYEKLGLTYCNEATIEYNSFSDADKKKVRFKYIDGVNQFS